MGDAGGGGVLVGLAAGFREGSGAGLGAAGFGMGLLGGSLLCSNRHRGMLLKVPRIEVHAVILTVNFAPHNNELLVFDDMSISEFFYL